MKLRLWMTLAVILLLTRQHTTAQSATGSLSGVVRDPSGAVVPNAQITIQSATAETRAPQTSNSLGHYAFEHLQPGRYQLTVSVPGFVMASVRNVEVRANAVTPLNLSLRIAAATAEVRVAADDDAGGRRVSAAERAHSRNVAEIAAEEPGVSLRSNGELATAPILHGLGEERARIIVNGAVVSSSCPNYMNDPLSYASSARAANVSVQAGITPVSTGGDNLAGTIAVDSNPPAFADQGHTLAGVSASSFYRSNGQYYGGAANAWIARQHLALGYSGSWSTNDDYTDGYGHKVTSSYAQSTDHVVTLAAQFKANLIEAEAGIHHTPYEGFTNAQMDLVRNWAESANLHYRRTFSTGQLDGRVWWQGAWHGMNVGRDKLTFPMPMWMPMNTHGRDTGYSLALEEHIAKTHTLRIGQDLHRFRLDDRWPAVAGASMMMAPNTFINLNNGRRTRMGIYGEVQSRWSEHVGTVLGLRSDTVWSRADAVSGYSSMYASDAAAFNALDRSHTNTMVDVTASAHWDATPLLAFEGGYARKNRAPSLYERYAWSRMWMVALMVGWYGDGNGYVGNNALRPETNNTLSGSIRLRGRSAHAWQLKASPYVNLLTDFIDADQLTTKAYGMATLAKLQWSNHPARIYGGDLSGSVHLWDSLGAGLGTLSGTAAWMHGERTDSNTPLYQMMPMNARLRFREQWRTLDAGWTLTAVDRKRNVDPNRLEPHTAGYALLGLHASYTRGPLEAGITADNLFNRGYALPLGGVNVDDFQKSMWMDALHPLTGRGRSVALHVTAHF